MSNFPGEFLRILKPVTKDGVNLKYDDDMQPIYKESHAPVSSKKYFEAENVRLPSQLRMVIEHAGVQEAGKVEVKKPTPKPSPKPKVQK